MTAWDGSVKTAPWQITVNIKGSKEKQFLGWKFCEMNFSSIWNMLFGVPGGKNGFPRNAAAYLISTGFLPVNGPHSSCYNSFHDYSIYFYCLTGGVYPRFKIFSQNIPGSKIRKEKSVARIRKVRTKRLSGYSVFFCLADII